MSERTRIQRKKTGDSERETAPPLVHDALHSGGEPLDEATRAFMEPRFGYDFGQIQTKHLASEPLLQPKLTINQPGDIYEQEADRVADTVVNGGEVLIGAISSTPSVQRDAADESPPQSSGQLPPDAEWLPSDSGPSASKELTEGAEAISKAIQKTPAGMELIHKAAELGANLWSHLEGKVVVIVSGAAALGTLFVANGELPAPIPDIPLDWAVPGLKANLTYEGPLRSPTKVMLTLTLSFGEGGQKREAAIPAASDAQADEIRRFQQSIRYAPGTPEAREEAAQKAAYEQWVISRIPSPKELGDPARLGLSSPNGWQGANPAAEQPNLFQLTPPTFGEDPRKQLLPPLMPKLRLDEPFIMRKASEAAETMAAPPVVHEVLQSSGHPLDDTTRAFMEPRFGRDFGHVRVHTDSAAARSAQAVNALAYTVGGDVVFGAGQYQPGSDAGKRLIAHELTHTLQQSNLGERNKIHRSPVDTDNKSVIDHINPPGGPRLISVGADAARAVALVLPNSHAIIMPSVLGDVELRPGAIWSRNRMIVNVSPMTIYYTIDNRLYEWNTSQFIRDEWLNSLSQGAKNAEGMVYLAKAEMALIVGFLVPWEIILGVGIAKTAIFYVEHKSDIHRGMQYSEKAISLILEIREKYPHLFNIFLRTALHDLLLSLPSGVSSEDVAFFLGRVLRGVGGLPEATFGTVLRITGRVAAIVTATHLPAIAARAAARAAKKKAIDLQRELAEVGVDVSQDEARAILQELLMDPNAEAKMRELEQTFQALIPVFDGLRALYESP